MPGTVLLIFWESALLTLASRLCYLLPLSEPLICFSYVSKLAIVKEFFCFLRVRKKWWLAPIVLFLLLLGALLIFAEGSAIAPFIYSLF
jgi:hypothetical protein